MKLAQSFVLADPAQHDCPIVYASERFLALTGHPRSSVLGRNCRFLQVGTISTPPAVRLPALRQAGMPIILDALLRRGRAQTQRL